MKKTNSEDAVSPVIGVILMVVITVIIAAILAVFAFGIGAPNKAPETHLKFVAVGGTVNTLTIYNTGGDSLILKDEKITVKNAADPTLFYLGAAATGGVPLGTGTATLPPGASIIAPAYTATTDPTTGTILNIQVTDVPTGQLIADAKITVQ